MFSGSGYCNADEIRTQQMPQDRDQTGLRMQASAVNCPSRALSHRFMLLKSKTESADGLSLSASSFYDASLPCLVPVCPFLDSLVLLQSEIVCVAFRELCQLPGSA